MKFFDKSSKSLKRSIKQQNNPSKSSLKPNLRVHIALVGHDLEDRIYLPIRNLRSDRVYLIIKEEPNMFRKKVENIEKRLINEYNLPEKEIHIIECDIFDFTQLSKTVASLIGKEKRENNQIFYNISSGGTLNAAVGLLICMLFDVKPYFIKKDFNANSIPEPLDFISIPEYNIPPPEMREINLLRELKLLMINLRRIYLYKKQILELLPIIDGDIKKEEIIKNPSSSRLYNLLNNRYLNKMEKEGYISIERRRNGKVTLTSKGEFTSEIFNSFYHTADNREF